MKPIKIRVAIGINFFASECLKRASPYVGCCLFYLMAVTLCPRGLEVESGERVVGRFECPNCGKKLGEIDVENEGGWFSRYVSWLFLVS